MKSLGAQMLCAVDATQAEIATACGRSRALVGHWRNSIRSPSDEDEVVLERLYGIPRAAWGQPPKRVAGEPPPPPLDDVERAKSARELAQETSRKAQQLLAQAEQRGVGTREAAALLQAANSATNLLLRCENDEEKILRSPSWRRIENVLVEALRPFPKAATAIADALDRIRDGDV